MSEYTVSLKAYVTAEWVGEADSAEHAEELALAADDLVYEVDFEVERTWGPEDDEVSS